MIILPQKIKQNPLDGEKRGFCSGESRKSLISEKLKINFYSQAYLWLESFMIFLNAESPNTPSFAERNPGGKFHGMKSGDGNIFAILCVLRELGG